MVRERSAIAQRSVLCIWQNASDVGPSWETEDLQGIVAIEQQHSALAWSELWEATFSHRGSERSPDKCIFCIQGTTWVRPKRSVL